MVGQVRTKVETDETLPEEIQKLVDDTNQVLFPEQVEKFKQLVLEYRDVFSTTEEPLGQTSVVQHEIKTTGPPIKSQYC